MLLGLGYAVFLVERALRDAHIYIQFSLVCMTGRLGLCDRAMMTHGGWWWWSQTVRMHPCHSLSSRSSLSFVVIHCHSPAATAVLINYKKDVQLVWKLHSVIQAIAPYTYTVFFTFIGVSFDFGILPDVRTVVMCQVLDRGSPIFQSFDFVARPACTPASTSTSPSLTTVHARWWAMPSCSSRRG